MEAYIQEVENLYRDYKSKKSVLDKIKAKIREKISGSYFKWENKLDYKVLFTLSLFWGRYCESIYDLPHPHTISRGGKYNNNTKKFENQEYYDIYRKTGSDFFGNKLTDKKIGVVCSINEFSTTFYGDDFKKMWLWYLKNKSSYEGSLADFKQKFSNPKEFYDMFGDYIYRTNMGRVYLFNYPSMKVNNMVIYIND